MHFAPEIYKEFNVFSIEGVQKIFEGTNMNQLISKTKVKTFRSRIDF